jgi:hypothetical protein
MGIQDARSTRGIFSRGRNVYSGGVSAPNNQKGNARFSKEAIKRKQGLR